MKRHYPEEFIGREISVFQGKNRALKGIKGKIIDETKNAFKIITVAGDEKTVLKKGTLFMINNQKISGEDIIRRPEERIKTNKE